ncbi:metallopeptidase family m24, putative [Ichthyophthirius multifiliis]|uniref:FACT complex subunit n=1 Tax=Ichthyophthirius multifiliis TaxID=5932 RepID=G0QWF3_ICHMU|nr:metallopeptidase family m24, putative [Ichthyophthirius multifiliis]EGR30454.1 metallopeptidase family m24, putative [Ichthyophthirius multifiliis]|eukprot:XP_004032041.1 metallopeptidase family m24, putative [Ichthyophthirius multifiliis]
MSKIKAESFYKHHQQLLFILNQPQYQTFDALIIKNGKEEGSNKKKTSAVSLWYFGYDFVDTITLITRKSYVLIAGSKKIQMLSEVQNAAESKQCNFQLIEKDPQVNSKNIEKLFQLLSDDIKKDTIQIGSILKEQQSGPFMKEFDEFTKNKSNLKFVDCSSFIQDCLGIKDQQEISYIGKASKLSVYLESRLIKEIENIIENEEKKTHLQISSKIAELMENEKELKKIQEEIGGDVQSADLAYTPIVQSGGKYDLKPSAESNKEILQYDTIILSVGTRYMEYHSNIVRTLFIDPTSDQKKIYQRLYELQNLLAIELKPGVALCDIYQQATKFIKEKIPQLQDKLPANFGYGIGLEFNEKNLEINSKNEKKIEEGMVFNVTVGFDNLENEKSKKYAIQLSDTVAIRNAQMRNAVMTYKVSRKYEDVSYSIQDEDQDEEEQEDDLEKENIISDGRRTRNAYHKNKTIVSEKERMVHQLELREKKLDELKKRLSNNNFFSSKTNQKNFDFEKIQCFKQIDDIPKDFKKNQIHIDIKHECILLPINGELVPFHISLIKNYQKIDEGKTYTLRLNFHNISGGNLSNIQFPKNEAQSIYIKELSFRSKNSKNLQEIMKKIKDLQTKIKQNEQDQKQREDIIEQEKLQIRQTKRPALHNLKMRPTISKQKQTGVLELHLNGFRYTTRNEKVDLVFSNIKHAFFQPCDNEMIVALHFHLHHPLIIGKKKTNDVQFYMEAGLPPEDLNVETQIGNKISFEVPYSNLGFHGSAYRSTCLFQPTENTLMNIIETPFFVMSLEDVELACFERMIGSLRNFDLVFIFKDYEKAVTRIVSIPMENADNIKSWLNSQDILYFESTKNFALVNILKTIRADIQGFVEDGGWNILLGESDNEEENEQELDDESFNISGDEEEYESDDDFSDSDDDYTEDSEDDFTGDEDLSEEGLDSEDMEEEFEREERQKRNNMAQKNNLLIIKIIKDKQHGNNNLKKEGEKETKIKIFLIVNFYVY